MPYDPRIHHRRTIRLQTWDYSWASWYYVTIVVKHRSCVFGEVEGDHVVLSHLGKAADACWQQIPEHHTRVDLDDYIIMPNHVHGIIVINSEEIGRDVQLNVPTEDCRHRDPSRRDVTPHVPIGDCQRLYPSRSEAMGALSPKRGSVSVIVRTFKGAVTKWARSEGFEDFGWQPRFHEQIIRNEDDLRRIQSYIVDNPVQWAIDEEKVENRTAMIMATNDEKE